MKRRSYLCMAILIAITSCPAWADLYDYGDAIDYGSASHSTPTWQQLGDGWDAEGTQRTVDNFDDGVVWSIDSGSTWGSDLTLTRGQEVTFRFDMRRVDWGIHSYDQIKAWIDWDGDLQFDNSPGSDEIILAEMWDKGDTKWLKGDYDYLTYGRDLNPAEDPLQKYFYATLTVPDYAVDEIWLRARVHCNHTTFDNITPTGYLYQGEVEDYELNVVPVPSGIILAGIGLAVAQWRLKRKESLAS